VGNTASVGTDNTGSVGTGLLSVGADPAVGNAGPEDGNPHDESMKMARIQENKICICFMVHSPYGISGRYG
jgi:hypothetical protein